MIDHAAVFSSETPAGGGAERVSGFGPATLASLSDEVVGRSREIEVVVAALMAGRHLLLEGPPGTGKSTLLRALARSGGTGFVFVEGNADLTPSRLTGVFDPAQVLERGYHRDIWIDGPLTAALRHGHLLYIEEINRIPEETLNLLVSVMSERELVIPRLGTIGAHPQFRLVAAMNPFDAVGTARIAGAIYDRMCRVSMEYQTAAEEAAVATRAAPASTAVWAEPIVTLVRATRQHPDVRIGASVRGAIDWLLLAHELAGLRQKSPMVRSVGLDAAMAALSGRIRLHEATQRTAESVIAELWDRIMAPYEEPDPAQDSTDPADDADAPQGTPEAADGEDGTDPDEADPSGKALGRLR